ncbi:MAG: YqaA family protein, partial [Gemmatimonadota bacterium]
MGDDRARGAGLTATDPAGLRGPRSWSRRLYHWVLSWSEHPQATWALFVLAFAESSFFPIPPDILLIALCLGKPARSLWYASVCVVGSVLGGL